MGDVAATVAAMNAEARRIGADDTATGVTWTKRLVAQTLPLTVS
ncbi:hypothetical protein [Nocardia amamiensis]|nr:hypothetical protein [Nocardia amamiensis]